MCWCSSSSEEVCRSGVVSNCLTSMETDPLLTGTTSSSSDEEDEEDELDSRRSFRVLLWSSIVTGPPLLLLSSGELDLDLLRTTIASTGAWCCTSTSSLVKTSITLSFNVSKSERRLSTTFFPSSELLLLEEEELDFLSLR